MSGKKIEIKLWLQEYKKIIRILVIGWVFVSVLLFQNNVKLKPIKISSEAIGVIGTLLGAVVGGVFSLAGSVWVAKMQQKAQREVLKKNIIYKPLYDELIKNDRILKQENCYPKNIRLNNEYPSIGLELEFCIWTKIKDDSRFLETPKEISLKMIELQQIAEDFIAIKEIAIEELNKCWQLTQVKFSMESEGYYSMDEWALSLVLASNKDCATDKLYYRLNSFPKKYSIDIVKEFNEFCNKNQKILEVYSMKMLYTRKQSEMIDLLTKYIKYVELRYEE